MGDLYVSDLVVLGNPDADSAECRGCAAFFAERILVSHPRGREKTIDGPGVEIKASRQRSSCVEQVDYFRKFESQAERQRYLFEQFPCCSREDSSSVVPRGDNRVRIPLHEFMRQLYLDTQIAAISTNSGYCMASVSLRRIASERIRS